MSADSVPIVDVAPLVADPSGSTTDALAVAQELDRACREVGFFVVAGHGVDPELAHRLDALAREFFTLPEADKAKIAMSRAGRAWRGWFPVGDELTSGLPDRKEGLYFGQEHAPDHPRVLAKTPLHGANLWPAHPAGLGAAVTTWMTQMTDLGRLLMRGLALGLGLPASWFDDTLLADPTVLFRIFHYPPAHESDDGWGVGEHTDYGLLTVLMQDDCGGLEVRTPAGWRPVPPVPGTFVCNLGDMLEKMTAGLYRSTAHRVRNTSGRSRLSFPCFIDPGWDAAVAPILATAESTTNADAPAPPRWDGAGVTEWSGPYGQYLLAKVAKVFPELPHGS